MPKAKERTSGGRITVHPGEILIWHNRKGGGLTKHGFKESGGWFLAETSDESLDEERPLKGKATKEIIYDEHEGARRHDVPIIDRYRPPEVTHQDHLDAVSV